MLTQAPPSRANSGQTTGTVAITDLGRAALAEDKLADDSSAASGERIHIQVVAFSTPQAFEALDHVCSALEKVGFDVGFEPARLETSARPVYGVALWARRRES